jgi:glycosyltransferase involved in cell wall biosynthesis
MQRIPLSVLVTTFNEAENLPACLDSVRWAEDVLVVDSGSTDATAAIARAFGTRWLEHPYESAARQKNWALPFLRHPWVLILDADERVSAELAAEIRAVVAADGPEDGYFLHRTSRFLGREIRHCGWDRDDILRLVRAGRGRYDDRMVHEELQLEGHAGKLRGPLRHDTVRSLRDYLDKLDRYTARGAADLRRAGRRPAWTALVLRPPARFLRMYLLQRGFLDGIHGLLLCTLAAFSVWLKYARLYEPESAADGATAAAVPRVAAPEDAALPGAVPSAPGRRRAAGEEASA